MLTAKEMFYPTLWLDYPLYYLPMGTQILLPASSFARRLRLDGSLPIPDIGDNISGIAVDCGGFVASRIWGEYRYPPSLYVDWIIRLGKKVGWAATMDWCCEPPLTSHSRAEVVRRQTKTTLTAWLFWDEYRFNKWVWIPTIQGWEVNDYVEHAIELLPLIEKMKAFYEARGQGHLFRVGLGTLCTRATNEMIDAVIQAVSKIIPDVRKHLWGVKYKFLASKFSLKDVVSFDSAAWCSFGLHSSGVQATHHAKALKVSKNFYAGKYLLPQYCIKIDEALQGKVA